MNSASVASSVKRLIYSVSVLAFLLCDVVPVEASGSKAFNGEQALLVAEDVENDEDNPVDLFAAYKEFDSCAEHAFRLMDDSSVDAPQIVRNKCNKPIRVVFCCIREKRYGCGTQVPFGRVIILRPGARNSEQMCQKTENIMINGCINDKKVLDYRYVAEKGDFEVSCGG